ncbi:MAG TPA: hypothetical protein VF733_01610 [Candidatus Saccharimonadales bacterium]
MIYARGEGKNVLSALSRVSLALMGGEDGLGDTRIFGHYGSSGLYESTQWALAISEEGVQDCIGYSVDTMELSGLMHWSGVSIFDERLNHHNNILTERVKDGTRSPASVNEELSLQIQDGRLLRSVSRRWFSKEGWVLTAPRYRKAYDSPVADARWIYRVTKSQRLDPEVKENLFDAIPKRGQAYCGQRSPLNFHKTQGYLNERRPFLLGTDTVEDVYGYIASGSRDFVPVITRQRPWRRGE